MAPASTQQTVSRATDSSPVSGDSPWRLKLDEPISQMPWRRSKLDIASPSPSPCRPPPPSRPPPPIPVTQPDTGITEPFPQPELPTNVLAHLIASLEGGKDINNFKHKLQAGGMPASMNMQGHESATHQLSEHHQPPPPLQMIDTQHSHHSSKNSAGHSYAFAGGRGHKASVTSTSSSRSRRMTTEEKLSEVDAFFGLDD